jgi:hypothetical protein
LTSLRELKPWAAGKWSAYWLQVSADQVIPKQVRVSW